MISKVILASTKVPTEPLAPTKNKFEILFYDFKLASFVNSYNLDHFLILSFLKIYDIEFFMKANDFDTGPDIGK